MTDGWLLVFAVELGWIALMVTMIFFWMPNR